MGILSTSLTDLWSEECGFISFSAMIQSSASVGPDNCCCSSVEYLNLLFYTKIERNLFLNCCMISNLCLWLFQYYFMTERTLAEINPGDEDFGKHFVAWLFSQPAVAWESQMVEEHSRFGKKYVSPVVKWKLIRVCVVHPSLVRVKEQRRCGWKKPSWFCVCLARKKCNHRGCSKVQKWMVAKMRKMKVSWEV